MRTLESIKAEIKALGEVDLFGTSKEVSHLPEVLHDDENIKYLTSGLMNGTTWLIVCTQKRIILIDYGMFFGVKQSEMNLENINSISYQTGLFFGSIEIWHGNLTLNLETHEVTADGAAVRLTRTEFGILRLLMQNPRQVITKSQLLDQLSADTPDCVESSLKVHVSNLRRKLREAGAGEVIEAVWGIGFKLKE